MTTRNERIFTRFSAQSRVAQDQFVRTLPEFPGAAAFEEAPDVHGFLGAFSTLNDFSRVDRGLDAMAKDFGPRDDEWDAQALIRENKNGEFDDIIPMIVDDSDLAYRLQHSQNREHFEELVRRQREINKHIADAFADPGWGVAGAAAGLILSPSSWIPIGLAGKGGFLTWQAVKNARAANMARVALVEGALQGGIQTVENLGDPSGGLYETALAGGIGGILGGTVGVFMPHSGSARALVANEFDKFNRSARAAEAAGMQPADLGAAAQRAAEDVQGILAGGAAGTPEHLRGIATAVERMVDPKVAASLRARWKIPGIHWMMSIKQRDLNEWARVAKKGEGTPEAEATAALIALKQKFYDQAVPTRAEVRGAVRLPTFESLMRDELGANGRILATARAESLRQYSALRAAHPEIRALERKLTRMNVANQQLATELKRGLSEIDYQNFAGAAIRRMAELEETPEAAIAKVLETEVGEMAEPLRIKMVEGLTSTVERYNRAFREMLERAVDAGIGDDETKALLEAAKKSGAYLPQSHVIPEYIGNPKGAKEFIEYNMFGSPSPEFIDEAIEDALKIPEWADDAGLVQAGIPFELQEPAAKEVLLNMWRAFHLDRAEKAAEELLEEAKKAVDAQKGEGVQAGIARWQRKADEAERKALFWRNKLIAESEREGHWAEGEKGYAKLVEDETTDGVTFFRAVDEEGGNVLFVDVRVKGKTLVIENIGAETAEGVAPQNVLGPRVLLNLVRDLKKRYPKVTEVAGERVTGIRHGGESVLPGEGAQVTKDINKLLAVADRRFPKREWHEGPDEAKLAQWEKHLEARERDWQEAHDRIKAARLKMKDRDGMEEVLKEAAQTGTAGERFKAAFTRRALAKAEKVAGKKEATLLKVATRDMKTIVDDVYKNITSSYTKHINADGFDMLSGAKVGKDSAEHPRQISLARSIAANDERMHTFVNQDMEHLSRGYFQGVGGRVAFKEVFGTTEPMELFEDLLASPSIDATFREQSMLDLNSMIDAGLGRAHIRGTGESPSMRWTANQFKKVNSVSFLGSVLFALTTDTSLVHAATETPGIMKTAKMFARAMAPRALGGKANAKQFVEAFHAFEAPSLLALSIGPRHLLNNAAVQRSRFFLDERTIEKGLGVPGTQMYKMTSRFNTATDNLSHLAMKINGMNPWNNNADMVLREFIMTEIMTKGSRLPEGSLERLRIAGLRAGEIDQMAAAARKHLVEIDGVQVPNIDAMPVEMQRKWWQALNAYSANGIIEPGIGDVPRFFRDPLGSMVAQFSSFPYTAQNRWLRRMQQKGFQDQLALESMLMALMATTVATGAKKVLSGQGEEWYERWETPHGAIENLYEIFLRSPAAVAAIATVLETLTKLAAPAVNPWAESTIGTKVIPERGKFRATSAMEALLGPSFRTGARGFDLINGLATFAGDPNAANAEDLFDKAVDLSIGSHFAWRAFDGLIREEE